MTSTQDRARQTAHDPTGQTGRQGREPVHEPGREHTAAPLAERLAGRVGEGFRVRAERFCERHLPIPDRPPPEGGEDSEDPTTAQAAFAHLERAFGGSAAWLFYVGLMLLTLWVTLTFAVPEAALAQGEGGGGGGGGGDGGAIQGTIDNARNWLSTIMVSLGGLGMIASIAVKAVARTNENMHHAAHMGMTGSGIALIAGLLINDIISLLQSFVG